MNKPLILLFLFSLFYSCQEKSFNYKILQYEGTDSLNTKVVKKVKFNSDSLVIYEEYRGYKSDNANSTSDVNTTYIYKDTLLTKTIKYRPNLKGVCCDSSKMEFFYNNKNLLEKRIAYDYRRILKKGMPFKDNLTSDDFEKERQWKLSSETFYSYDNLGRKIEYNAPEKHWSSQNRYVWTYDNQNRIKEEKSFDQERLIWTKFYEYQKNSYKYTMTWYDYEGNPRHLKDKSKSWEYRPQKICEYKLNDNGQELEELATTETGEFISKLITEYDIKNRIAKTTKYLEKDKPIMTHIYVYE
ncbi:hypothetical protein [Winogradskyella endarachnes]|uniref:hypothetical protein n=1 Tax=Winogradskyella endarachnes TaxID=2681965 RepID=UPI0012FAC4AA|nr:hypothetical protein [Winogradskyella endarachnes]